MNALHQMLVTVSCLIFMIVQIFYEGHLNPVFEITMIMMAVYNYFSDHQDQSWQALQVNMAGLSAILILLDSHGCANFLRSILTREYGHHDQSWQGNMAGLSPCAWRGIQPLEGFRSARVGLNIDHRLEFRSGRWWAWCSGVRYSGFLIEWIFCWIE